ncbi:hypothetical protein SCHPADRAFT_893612 [Schizopora paradoxa]|uniref:Transcription factor domain-containing protein n=1 Tax=Schizopora paradoxa TaxID=27342 RepID=A0A0H2RAF0_9AGAM|nr:hypothetical protein SCHPADRAFT_893612 [Schizopora paradoxa]
MASPFDFASQGSNVSPNQFQGQQIFSSPDMGLGMGNLGVDMLGNPAGMSTPNLNADMSMGLGAGSESMLFASNVQGGFASHQQQLQSRMPPSRSSSQGQTMPGGQSQLLTTGDGTPPFNSALMDTEFLQPHVMYYFDSVLPMQYLFQQKNASAVIQDLLRSEPLGVLTNASCALASLHNKTLRVSRMLEQPDPVPQQSTATQLYDRAFWLLANKTNAISASLEQPQVGEKPNYSVSEVLGALHCVAYYLMQGGIGEWSSPLTAARYWLEKTAESAEDPKGMFMSMSEAERLAVKMTIWYDTFSAISLQQAPRFVDLCRRLLDVSAQQAQQASNANNDTDPSGAAILHMEQLMGCPDGVLLVLIETAALAHWKEVERARGALSTRELLRRGDAIEDMLRAEAQWAEAQEQQQQMASAMHTEHTMSSHMHPSRPSGEHNAPPPNAPSQFAHGHVVGPAAGATGASGSASGMSAMLAANMSGNTGTPTGSARPSPRTHTANLAPAQTTGTNTDLFITVTKIFCETAGLYLQTVVNEPSSNVPEVGAALLGLQQALQQLPSSAATDRALTLPIALAAFVADDLTQREFFKQLLTTPDPSIGNMQTARALAEQVWRRRDATGGVVDWRFVMRDLGLELLLI